MDEKRGDLFEVYFFFCHFKQWIIDKVNDFLKSHPEIEVIDIKFTASFGSIYAAILFR